MPILLLLLLLLLYGIFLGDQSFEVLDFINMLYAWETNVGEKAHLVELSVLICLGL